MVHFHSHFYTRVVFILGVIVGILIFIVGKKYINVRTIPSNVVTNQPEYKHMKRSSYNIWFEDQGLLRKNILWDDLRYNHNLKFTIEADFLFAKIKIVCLVLVRKAKNANALKSTWGRGCNHVEFVNIDTNTNKLPPMKRMKTKSSWILLCEKLKKISTEYDWILVINDNTFVIMENLRFHLAPLNASDKYYLGHAVKFWNTVYNSASAGYVLSRGTLNSFKEKCAIADCSRNTYWNREDFYLGHTLATLNITPMDTRDSDGFSTFHPYNLYQLFFPSKNYYEASVFLNKCCSKKSISFQGIEGDKIYTYHYLLYNLQIFSKGNLGNMHLPQTKDDDQVWKTFLKGRNISVDNVTSQQYYKIWEDLIDDPTSFAAHMQRENFEND